MAPVSSCLVSSPSTPTHSVRLGVAGGISTPTSLSMTRTAARPEDAARDCSQARWRHTVEHQVGMRPRALTSIGPPHHPQICAAARRAAAGVDLPPLERSRRRFLSARQVDELADAAGDGRAAVLVLTYCGLRWSEFAALRVRHMDLMRRRIDVSEAVTEVNGSRLAWGTPKSHERRPVPIPRFLVDELTIALAGRGRDELAFPGARGGVLRNRPRGAPGSTPRPIGGWPDAARIAAHRCVPSPSARAPTSRPSSECSVMHPRR